MERKKLLREKKFVDSAKVIYKELNVKVSELSEEQKRKLIDRHRKKVLEEVLLCADIFKLPTFKKSLILIKRNVFRTEEKLNC